MEKRLEIKFKLQDLIFVEKFIKFRRKGKPNHQNINGVVSLECKQNNEELVIE